MLKTEGLLGLGLGLALCAAGLVACSALPGGYTLPDQHPEEIPRAVNPICTDCHDPEDDDTLPWAEFSHRPSWSDTHRNEAYRNEKLCAMCHSQRFCNECHTTRVELKPSVFREGDTYRRLPHRGDYLSRHRIDARTDPSSCFRCHGNPKSSQTCTPCHG